MIVGVGEAGHLGQVVLLGGEGDVAVALADDRDRGGAAFQPTPESFDTSLDSRGAAITGILVPCAAGDLGCIDEGTWRNVRYTEASGDTLSPWAGAPTLLAGARDGALGAARARAVAARKFFSSTSSAARHREREASPGRRRGRDMHLST